MLLGKIVYERTNPEPPRYVLAYERKVPAVHGSNNPRSARTYWQELKEYEFLRDAKHDIRSISRYDRGRYAIFDRKKQ